MAGVRSWSWRAVILGSLRHRHSLPSSLVPLHIDLGPHGESLLHIVCAKSAMAVPRVQAIGDLLLRELSQGRHGGEAVFAGVTLLPATLAHANVRERSRPCSRRWARSSAVSQCPPMSCADAA